MIAAGVYAGDSQEGLQVLQPLRQFGEPLGEIAGAIPYRGVQSAFDASLPNTGEVIAYWKSLYLDDLTESAYRDHGRLRGESQFGLDDGLRTAPWRRCTARKARRDSFSARDAAFVMNFMGDWRDPRETPRHVAWVREAWNRLKPHGTGKVYLNYLGREERDGDALVRSAFGSNYDRLVGIKTKYDPTNFFRLNQNIKPALTPA